MFGCESVIILQSELSYLGLAVRACLPTHLRALVSTDMDVFRREEVAYLSQDILEELHGLLLADAEDVISDAPASPDFIWPACASQLRIGCQSRKHMTRQVDFRNDGYAFCCSIFKNLLDLFLREPAAFSISDAVIFGAFEKMTYEGLVSYRSDFCEFRIFLDLKSPSLVISKMPVKGIELVYFHDVEISLHFIHVEEVAGYVHMHSPVPESRCIFNPCAWEFPVSVGSCSLPEYLYRKHLLQSLNGIVESAEAGCLYLYFIGSDVQPVSLGCRFPVKNE